MKYTKQKDIRTPFEACRDTAWNLIRRKRFKEAEDYCLRCLGLASAPEERAVALNDLGCVRQELKDTAQAEASYKDALQIYKELAATNPQTYRPDVAAMLLNLSILYQEAPSKTKSLQYAKEAEEALNGYGDTPEVQNIREGVRQIIDYWKGKN